LDWPSRFAIRCWLLWKRRCSLLLSPDMSYMDDILRRGNRLVADCNNATTAVSTASARYAEQPQWMAPSHGYVKPLADMVSVIGEEMLESGSVDREAEGVG
ncbi:hypothetical protein V6N12_001409, partial [Hibiscus sabdariffa]